MSDLKGLTDRSGLIGANKSLLSSMNKGRARSCRPD